MKAQITRLVRNREFGRPETLRADLIIFDVTDSDLAALYDAIMRGVPIPMTIGDIVALAMSSPEPSEAPLRQRLYSKGED